MNIIAGLGNPGQRYRHTRHNFGFDVIDLLAHRYNIPMRQRDAHAICGKGFIRHRAVLLAKPQTYMNRSGLAVAPLVQCYLQSGEQAVIIHGDLDLPLGTIRVKQRGGMPDIWGYVR
ncbi:MAG: aminoacyl-tRNA hydrolase [Candidatus Tectomicrobia bacterium]